MNVRELTPREAATAESIQNALDALAASGGGRLQLPEMDCTLDRGLQLRSGVELAGRGEKTVLRKGPGRVYPLAGYHNYGMCDAPLRSAKGLSVGMTVMLRDNLRRGFYSTLARILWIDGSWVGLDCGLRADYAEAEQPRLATVHPLVFGLHVRGAAVRDLCLDGRRDDQEEFMDACRGAALYLYQCRDVEFSNIAGRDCHGEGLGFQMCRDIVARGCRFEGNAGNGFHPGAGSTNCLFEDCQGRANEKSGFFFCVRANRITVRGSAFEDNAAGMSVGTRDCYNLIEDCRFADNRGPGVLFRPVPPSCPVHSVVLRRCAAEGNAATEGQGQIAVESPAHDIVAEGNRVAPGGGSETGIAIDPAARNIFLKDNDLSACSCPLQAEAESLASASPTIEAGYCSGDETSYRHLALVWEAL